MFGSMYLKVGVRMEERSGNFFPPHKSEII